MEMGNQICIIRYSGKLYIATVTDEIVQINKKATFTIVKNSP